MDGNNNNTISERILNLTLEIINLLTGEEYLVVKTSTQSVTPGNYHSISEEFSRTPHSLEHMSNKNRDILNLINRITELLTGEVPIRCQDVAIYFSLEEWEYLEGRKDLYKDVMMESPQSPTSPDSPSKRSPPERCLSPVYSRDSPEESRNVPQNHQYEDLVIKANIIKEETSVMGDQPCKEEERPTFIIQVSGHSGTITAEANLPSSQDCDLQDGAGHSADMVCEFSSEYGNQRFETAKQPFEFSDCGKRFTQTSYLTKPKTIRSEDSFTCNKCGKGFPRKKNLVLHQRVHRGVKPFICSECEKSFACKSDLIKHQRTHTGEKPFFCAECGKSFSRKSTLLQHHRTHTGERPYTCTFCMKSFTCKSVLITHTRIHTGEKPYSCFECGKCFTFKSDLANHKTTHTGEKLFPCSQCGKCFSRKSSLVQHWQIHTDEKRFVCPTCGKFYTRKYTLVKHQETHKDET